MDLHDNLKRILNKCLQTKACHAKSVAEVTKLYKNNEHSAFLESFLPYIGEFTQHNYKPWTAEADRCLDFFAQFIGSLLNVSNETSLDSSVIHEPVLFGDIFDYILELTNLSEDSIRYKSCCLIERIFVNIKGQVLSEDICQAVEKALIERVADGNSDVRVAAVRAIYVLQESTDLNCPIIDILQKHLLDRIAKVRIICIERIAPRRDVIPALVLRTRDVDQNVRLAAFKRLAKLPKHLLIIEKQAVIKNGFYDSSPIVNKYMKQGLVQSWFETYNCNYLKLLNALRLDGDEKDVEETLITTNFIMEALMSTNLQELRSAITLNKCKLIDFERLNWETVLIWKHLFVTLSKQSEDFREEISPDVPTFCQYIATFCELRTTSTEFLETQFILYNLFVIAKHMELAEAASRQIFNNFATNLLISTKLNSKVLESLMQCLETTIPSLEERCNFIWSVIFDAVNPQGEEKNYTDEIQVNQLKQELYSIREELSRSVVDQDFKRAKQLKIRMDELNLQLVELEKNRETVTSGKEVEIKNVNPEILYRCLEIAIALLVSPCVMVSNSALKMLNESLFEPLLLNANVEIRNKALRAYGLYCLVEKKTAQVGVHIFAANVLAYQSGKGCYIPTLVTSIEATSDMIALHGTDLITEPPDDSDTESINEVELSVFKAGTTLTGLVRSYVDLMDDDNWEVVESAGIALCNLIHWRRVSSPSLLSRMILKWCNPLLDEDGCQRLRSRIGMVLQEIPSVPNMICQLEDAFVPTLRVLLRAPHSSPLFEVDKQHIAAFILQLCRSCESTISDTEFNLSIAVCNEMLKKPGSIAEATYSRILLLFDLSKSDDQAKEELINTCKIIREEIDDRTVGTNVLKFMEKLKNLQQYQEE